jgi:hypothetical protein
MSEKINLERFDKLIGDCVKLFVRTSTYISVTPLDEAQLHYANELVFRFQQLRDALKRIRNEDYSDGWKLPIYMLDVEVTFWLTFKIIKICQKLPNFKRGWGGGFKISMVRNTVLEHFVGEQIGTYHNISISFPNKNDIVYRDLASTRDHSLYNDIDEFLSDALTKMPDLTEELKKRVVRKADVKKN